MRVGTGIVQYRMQLTLQVENHVEFLIFQILETLVFAVDRVRLDLVPKVFAVCNHSQLGGLAPGSR